MTNKENALLLSIAKEHVPFMEDKTSFDSMNCGADFGEVAVWTIEDMLKQAYEAGKAAR